MPEPTSQHDKNTPSQESSGPQENTLQLSSNLDSLEMNLPTKKADCQSKDKTEKKNYHLTVIYPLVVSILASVISLGAMFYSCEQTDISKQALRIGNRPYIGISEVTYGESGVLFSRTFVIKNSGQTPAYNTSVVYKWELLQNDSTHRFPQFVKKDSVASRFFIPAGGVQPFDIKEENIFPGYDDFEKGTVSFFIHGVIEYEDIFNERHFTKFGFRCKTDNIDAEYCEDHNTADLVK